MSLRIAVRSVSRCASPRPPRSPTSPRSRSVGTCNQPKVALISGAGAVTARAPTVKFLDRGYKVIGLTGNAEMQKYNSPEVRYVLIDRANLHQPDVVREAIVEGMEALGVADCTHLVGLNLIGGAVAPKDSTLQRLNLEIPLAFMTAVKATGEDTAEKTSFAHISSIAATVNGNLGTCDYAKIKKETDEAICALSDDHINALILRPGIILPEPDRDRRVNMGHDYSPEQMRNLLLPLVIGPGNQIQQPISENCLYEAMIKGLEAPLPGAKIVNAVGAPITQKELHAYFSERGVGFIHIPISLAQVIAEHFPLGRLAPYSVRMLETLEKANNPICGKDFEELLGRKPTTIVDLYKKGEFVGRESPLAKHMAMILRTIQNDPKKGLELLKGLKHVREITISGM